MCNKSYLFLLLINSMDVSPHNDCLPSIVRENGARLSCMYIINFNYINVMAKNVTNDKGFKVIALTPNECKDVGFGVHYVHGGINIYELICDNCNKLLNDEDEVYYIPILNRVFCKEGLIDWYNTAIYYPEDKHYENNKYNAILEVMDNTGVRINEDINIKDICHG